MAVEAFELYTRIKARFDQYGNGAFRNDLHNPIFFKILGDEMKKYFEEKIEVTYGWIAFKTVPGTPPTILPDPIVQFTSVARFPHYDLVPSKSIYEPASFTYMPTLAFLIKQAHTDAKIVHPTEFVLPSGTFKCTTLPPIMHKNGAVEDWLLKDLCEPTVKWYLEETENSSAITGIHLFAPGLIFDMGGTTTSVKHS